MFGWRKMWVGGLAVALLALMAAPAEAVVNPFINDQWQGLGNLDAANNANWIHVLASSPTSPNTMYAGTQLDGVFRSQDFGVTWSPLNDGLTGDYAKDVSVINVPTNPASAVEIGTAHGLFELQGSTWKPKAQGPEDDPAHPKKLNQSIQSMLSPIPGTTLAGTTNGVYVSTDGGDTWTPPASTNGMPAHVDVLSLVALKGPSPSSPFVLAATLDGVYRSSDFGSTWRLASDGMPHTSVQRLWADANYPEIAYAGTLGYGVYRTLNAGGSWAAANGSGTNRLGPGADALKVGAFMQFSGDNLTRLYAGTRDGAWAGETGKSPVPGAISWRRLTDNGLITPSMTNTIFWSFANFVNDLPGVLIGGTQSNGGYGLQMVPPEGPPASVVSDHVISNIRANDILTASVAGWKGTPTLEFTWQWQRCPPTGANPSCDDIDGATGAIYTVTEDDFNHRLKVEVTGRNDYPSFTSNISTRSTLLSDVVDHADMSNLRPGATSMSRPTSPTDESGNSIYQVGEKLTAPAETLFNPAATSKDFRWYRCANASAAAGDDSYSADCEVAAATDLANYTLTADDVHRFICYKVIGSNQYGSNTTPCGARTNDVVEPDPAIADGHTPMVIGGAYVGRPVSGEIGEYTWSPVTVIHRYWYLCDDTTLASCSPPFDGTPGDQPYTPKADEKGDRLRFYVEIDTNATNKPPASQEFWSPPSDPITDPPPDPPPPFDPNDPISNPPPAGADPSGGGEGTPTPTPTPTPTSTAVPSAKPRLASAKLTHKRVKPGGLVEIKYVVSGADALVVKIEQKKTGHKIRSKCRHGKPRRGQHKCTYLHKVGVSTVAVRNGSGHVTFRAEVSGRKLKKGTYVIVVVPYASKTKGTSVRLSLHVK